MEARAYHAEDLEDVRFQFLRTARNPKVSLGGVRQIRKLTYAFSSKDGRGAKGTCTVHRISKDADAIRDFYERLGTGLRYEGEGIPHATGKAILSVLRPVREQLPPERKAALYAEQAGTCQHCKEAFPVGGLECDHTVPLQEGGGNQAGNWQLLCRSCHQTKTGDEAFRGNVHPLQSRFAPAEYKAYVESPKVLPNVYQVHAPPEAKELLMLDCVRCRRNALFESAHPLPVFSPLDAIEECVPGTLGDLTFIDKPVRWQGGGSLLTNLPYQGAGWYSRVQRNGCSTRASAHGSTAPTC